MNVLAKSFFQGLLILAPIAITAYAVYFLVTLFDGWLPAPIPGLGLLFAVAFITLIGFLASNVFFKRAFDALESALTRLPVVKLVYTSLRDLLNAFVGEKRTFDRPVMVELTDNLKALGFVTCDTFDDPRLNGHVAVYLPQSYNFAGNLLVVPRDRVKRIDADGAQFMAFIVSGGVAEMSAARTVIDGGPLPLKT